jgi:hypothetical protein
MLYAENATRQYLQPFLDRFPQKFRVRSQVRKNKLHNDNANVSNPHNRASYRYTGCVNSCSRQRFGCLSIECVSDPDSGFLVIPDPSDLYPGF